MLCLLELCMPYSEQEKAYYKLNIKLTTTNTLILCKLPSLFQLFSSDLQLEGEYQHNKEETMAISHIHPLKKKNLPHKAELRKTDPELTHSNKFLEPLAQTASQETSSGK